MTYGPAQGLPPPRNRHKWAPTPSNAGLMRCSECFITREAAWAVRPGAEPGWSFRGDWHTGPIPRCGEAR